MCYFNGQKVSKSEYLRLKELEKSTAKYDFLGRPVQSGFEYGLNAVLKPTEGKDDFEILQMEWGFIPSYVTTREDVGKMRFGYRDSSGKYRPPITTLNAVSEELLLQGKIYRDAALNRRCLVLSSGFYEWRHIYSLNKRTGQPMKTANKYPYRITLKGKEYFFMAGVWQPWTDRATGEYVETFAIVTTKANELMQQVHNSKKRMPAILTEDLAWEWLLGNPDEKRITEIATFPLPAAQMEAYPVAKNFREAPEPTTRVTCEELPGLATV